MIWKIWSQVRESGTKTAVWYECPRCRFRVHTRSRMCSTCGLALNDAYFKRDIVEAEDHSKLEEALTKALHQNIASSPSRT